MPTARDVETLTHDWGREIFARLHQGGPIPFGPAWWDERLMDLTMSDPALKVQLFRFIDVLPALRRPPDVSGHLREYLGQAGSGLPGWARRGLRWLPDDGILGAALARTARANARRLARRFIAGSTVDEAVQAVADLRQRSLTFTVDLLGEATITEVEADRARDEYLGLVAGLSHAVNRWPEVPLIDRDDRGPIPRVNVSVKLSALYSQFDPIDPEGTGRAVLSRLRPVLRLAREHGAFVNVDMEQYAFKDLTLHLFRSVLDEDEFRPWPDVGIAIQAYLRDAAADLDVLHRWAERRGTPVTVRLVKGAYWDYETIIAAQEDWPVPVFQRKWESDANYETLSRFLLERHTTLRPAFASHNVRSLAHAIATAQMLGVPDGGYEIQMLYGMAEPIKDALASLGQRVRVYTPYGQLLPGMAYLVRRLLENTANESFLRASFSDHVPEEQLLMNPARRAQNADGRLRIADEDRKAEHGEAAFRNEPLSDFSREDNRRALAEAVRRVAEQFGRTYPPLVDGAEVATAQFREATNPSHQRQVLGRYGLATPELAERAVAAAHAALPAWRDTPVTERAALLRRAAVILRRRRWELTAWAIHESGKPWREADADVAEAVDFCEFYAQEMLRLAVPRQRDVPGEDNAYFYEPRGVAVVIAPWNFPLAILCGMTAAALVAGNPTVMKPAEQSTVVGAKLMEVFREAGVPPGVLHFLPGVGAEVGPTLVSHRDVSVVSFTGSRGVGLWINRTAAETPPGQQHVKHVLAEMGGKNAIIVDSDADLDEAVHGVAASAFGYAGQKCSACSRVILLPDHYDAFLERLIEATRSMTLAPAEDPGCSVGPVIDGEARRRILGMIEAAKAECRLAYAGDPGQLADEGHYVAPHIFAEVPPTASLAQEEVFGPVLAVMKARDLTEALVWANGTAYALTGGFYSRSPRNIERVKREFRVGNLYLNRKITGALVNRQPFGGFKLSGIGAKAGGPDYLLQFLVPRTITENTMRRGFAPEAS